MCNAAGAEAALLPGSGSTISDTVRGIMEPPRGTGITRLEEEEGEGEEVMVLGMVSPARSGLTEVTLLLLLSLDRVSVSTTSTTSS